MYDSYFFKSIKKVIRNILIFSFLVFTVTMIYLASEFTLLFNVTAGPLKVQVSQVSTISTGNVFARNYVSVQGERIIPLNIEYVETVYNKYTHEVKKQTVKGDYYAIVSGDKMVIALSPRGKQISLNTFSGLLRRIPSDQTAFYKGLVQKASPGDANLQLLPYMINGLMYDNINILVTVVMALALIISLAGMIWCVALWIKPEKHKAYKKLWAYGEPSDIISKIEDEYTNAQDPLRVGNLLVLNHWMLMQGLVSFRIARTDDLLWVYKKVTRKRVNGIVPAGKTYELVLSFSDRKTETVKMSGANVDMAIEKLQGRFPWAVYGYSEEIRALRDRRFNEFIQFVNSRKNNQNAAQ